MKSNDMPGVQLANEWSSLDRTGSPDEFFEYLKAADSLPAVQRLREETYRSLGRNGAGVDVGSGTGEVIHRLASLGVKGIGVDISRTMIEAARREFANCEFVLGSAYELPFPSGHFDWYRAERVMQVLDHPEAALVEAHRVLKPGGRIVLLNADLDATVFSTSSQYSSLGRAAISALVKGVPHGRIGTQLPQLMVEAGFKEIEAVPYVLSFDNPTDARKGILELAFSCAIKTGAFTFEDVHVLRDDMDKLASKGAFSCALTFFLVSGRR